VGVPAVALAEWYFPLVRGCVQSFDEDVRTNEWMFHSLLRLWLLRCLDPTVALGYILHLMLPVTGHDCQHVVRNFEMVKFLRKLR